LAQIIKEMKNNNIAILGTSEMRWSECGQFICNEVTVMFSGGSKHEGGVGVLLSKEVHSKKFASMGTGE